MASVVFLVKIMHTCTSTKNHTGNCRLTSWKLVSLQFCMRREITTVGLWRRTISWARHDPFYISACNDLHNCVRCNYSYIVRGGEEVRELEGVSALIRRTSTIKHHTRAAPVRAFRWPIYWRHTTIQPKRNEPNQYSSFIARSLDLVVCTPLKSIADTPLCCAIVGHEARSLFAKIIILNHKTRESCTYLPLESWRTSESVTTSFKDPTNLINVFKVSRQKSKYKITCEMLRERRNIQHDLNCWHAPQAMCVIQKNKPWT